ncbi:alpha/beta fold hydrolase [Actinophytocola oryzae]|uniref:Pimeloyl-ACP methyl ester carboxylesterase n=1 Tax=Actinophytocola oryzae TaxID=502181 RepID=A0A4R7UXW3_9PSEU|nr:alpha/beta hydrolase [Actinophytocola oryzae]TDV41718.1 pimeloyl-ACP methyl ester carboxylesterase [Actinophytocola oryzae]
MSTVLSPDGTRIAYEVAGEGPPLLIVDGAMCYRDSGPSRPLAAELSADFTVFTYDRRSRGESAVAESSPAREVEDIAALVKEAGGAAYVFGASSGAMLALEAANTGVGATKLAMYEPPLIVDAEHAPAPESALADMRTLVAQDRRGDAVTAFMRSVDVPGFGIVMMKMLPAWKKLKGVAHTLPYDLALLEGLRQGKPLPQDRWTSATMPTLVADGGRSPAYMRNGAAAMASVLPNATHTTVPGQTHLVKAKALAPVLRGFFLT